jgi:hypothetical protein
LASTNSSGIKTQTPVTEIRAIDIPFAVWPRIASMVLSALGTITVTHSDDSATRSRYAIQVAGGASNDWGKRGDWTMIVIIDTGIGIPREFQ